MDTTPKKVAIPALSFGQSAQLYDAVRPTYPIEAVRWALEPLGRGPLRIVDLGAGTGILTRILLALGHEVLPVEPDPDMRAQLAEATPGVRPLCGSAEDIPLAGDSVDAVVAGQAYHWFDPSLAHPQIARVLRAGGLFAAMWNDRDESVVWVAELALVASGLVNSVGAPHEPPQTPDPWFGPSEHARFRHSVVHTPDSLIGLIMSRSYYLTATAERQRRIRRAVSVLAHDQVDDDGELLELPYVTEVYRTTARRRG